MHDLHTFSCLSHAFSYWDIYKMSLKGKGRWSSKEELGLYFLTLSWISSFTDMSYKITLLAMKMLLLSLTIMVKFHRKHQTQLSSMLDGVGLTRMNSS